MRSIQSIRTRAFSWFEQSNRHINRGTPTAILGAEELKENLVLAVEAARSSRKLGPRPPGGAGLQRADGIRLFVHEGLQPDEQRFHRPGGVPVLISRDNVDLSKYTYKQSQICMCAYQNICTSKVKCIDSWGESRK